jgi:hypothetical protein
MNFKNFISIVCCIGCLASAFGQNAHFVAAGSWSKQPVSPVTMEQRIQSAAKEYQQYGQVSRVAFFDIAFPKDEQEYRSLDGFGVVLVTVLAHAREELPPRRLFVRNSDSINELKLITSISSESSGPSLTTKVLGQHRWEALYLFPVAYRVPNTELVMDYRINRLGFVLDRFKATGMSAIAHLPIAAPTRLEPNNSPLLEFVKREYPGFVASDTFVMPLPSR